jgi:hypothetical protein
MSTEPGLGLGVVVTGSASTVTVTVFEGTVTGVPELSITCSSKLHTPIVVRVPVDTVGWSPELQLNELPRLL